ncbi:dephospho-CoA kinase [Bordetella sp. 2513F-2]
MYSIGLTGGIGSGKSRVADMLAEWGAAVVDTDRIAHALTAPGGAAMPAIREAFGPQAVSADGALDRAWMRERVFREPPARAQLEALLHPLIGRETQAQAAQARGAYLVFVVPLLVESGRWRERVDRVCVVDCDPDTQVARVQARSGLTEEAIRRIMAAQAARATRLAAADDVILNDGATTPDLLRARAKSMHDRWIMLAAASARPVSGPDAPS